MSANNLIFAYSQENSPLSQNIDQELGSFIGPINHIPGGRTTAAPSLSDQILNQTGPVILFISDNFLKSAQCMNNALRLLQKKGADILPVIIPGEYRDEDSGETNQVETSFDRVSDIIQYINYWQDRYLDLRRQKRQLEEEIDEEKFNEHLKKMRDISSEVGEFLRLLRTTEYLTYKEFVADDFEALFSFLGKLDARDEYRKNKADNFSGSSSRVEKVEEVEREEESEPVDEVEQGEGVEINLEGIPGLELLEGKEEKPGDDDMNEIQKEEVLDEVNEGEDEQVIITLEEEKGSEEEEDLLIGDASDLYQQHPEAFEEEEEEVGPRIEVADASKSRTVEFDLEEKEATGMEGELGNVVENVEESEEVQGILRNVEGVEEVENVERVEEVANVEEANHSEEPLHNIEEGIAHANELLENGDISAGMDHYIHLLEQYPTEANLRYQYAIALVQYNKDFQNAAVKLTEAIQLDQQFEDAYFLLGELGEITEDFPGARQAYELLTKINPDYPKVQFRLGIVLANHFAGQEKKAIKALKHALKQEPENTDALYQYAVLLNEHLNKPKKAIKFFKATLVTAPDHPFAWYDLALLYHSQDQRKKAYKAYLKAVDINPELKTPENDEAFQILDKSKKKELEEVADAFREKHTIDALKANISQLEALLQAREDELKEEMEAREKADAPPQSRPGEGKTVLISGATAGIGKATAEIFAKNGYRLILNGRRAARLTELKNKFESEYDVNVKVLPFDISKADQVSDAVNSLEPDWHPIHILINNAGKARGFAPVHEAALEHWDEMIDTNLKGLLYLTRAISPYMVARAEGHIINVCSLVGKEVYPKGNVYCATKHAVDALTRAMRLDLLQHNIRVSQVSPAAVEETEFGMVRYDGDADKAAKVYEGFKPLASADVAEAIYFIASQPAHVNIQDILMMGTQQASSTQFYRSGREQFEEEE